MPSQAPAKAKSDTPEQFVGSVFKFSISTVVSFLFYGLSLIITSLLFPTDEGKAIYGEIDQFIRASNTIMTIVIFGLDQSFIRFFNEPPGKTSSSGLFRLCFYLSASILVVVGIICSLFLAGPLRTVVFNFKFLGNEIIPLLFLNAFFWMVVRYFTVLYRMEQSIKMYTVTAILMNFANKLFFLVGAFFENRMAGMVGASLFGWAVLAIFCVFMRHRILRPKRRDLDREALRAVLPYGAAVAPTAIMITASGMINGVFMSYFSEAARGVYNYAYSLSNIVTMVQGGFASFWGAYMYANYKTQQKRIKRVHGYLYLLILVFFALLIAFEDVLFWILSSFKEAQLIFPIMMLSAVFTILCETTVYGITIARKPIFDTIGIGLGLLTNILLCIALITPMGIVGAAIANATGNFVMFLFRTLIAQRFYPSMGSVGKTVLAVAAAILLAICGTLMHDMFVPKLLVSLVAIALYILLYNQEFIRFVNLGLSMLKSIFKRGK